MALNHLSKWTKREFDPVIESIRRIDEAERSPIVTSQTKAPDDAGAFPEARARSVFSHDRRRLSDRGLAGGEAVVQAGANNVEVAARSVSIAGKGAVDEITEMDVEILHFRGSVWCNAHSNPPPAVQPDLVVPLPPLRPTPAASGIVPNNLP